MTCVSRVPPSYKPSFASAQYAEINKKTKTEITPGAPHGGKPDSAQLFRLLEAVGGNGVPYCLATDGVTLARGVSVLPFSALAGFLPVRSMRHISRTTMPPIRPRKITGR